MPAAATATPTKLRSGDWGARVDGPAEPGQTIRIQAKSGKSWTATVERVIWTGQGVSIVSTRSTDSAGYSIRSGESYRRGVTAPGRRSCPMCGSRECARAWNPRDLCDEDGAMARDEIRGWLEARERVERLRAQLASAERVERQIGQLVALLAAAAGEWDELAGYRRDWTRTLRWERMP